MTAPWWDQQLSDDDEDRAEFIGRMLAESHKQTMAEYPDAEATTLVGTFDETPLFWRRVVEVILFHAPDARIAYVRDFA